MKEKNKTKVESDAELDARLDHMKRLPRGSFQAKPGATDLRNCKVRVTMYVDADVLQHFKERAAQPNAAPYQTQINRTLRDAMEEKTPKGVAKRSADLTDQLISALNDERVIAVLDERIKAQVKNVKQQKRI